jgi:hypothetical protein
MRWLVNLKEDSYGQSEKFNNDSVGFVFDWRQWGQGGRADSSRHTDPHSRISWHARGYYDYYNTGCRAGGIWFEWQIP